MASIKTNTTFREETGKRLKNTSQLKLFNILQDLDNREKFINIFRCYIVNGSVLDNERFYDSHEIGDNDWPDSISYQYYETESLWWLIMMINNIVNPFEELTEGKQLKILKPQYIYKVLKEIENVGGI